MSQYANRLIAQAKAEGWKRLHLGCTRLNGPVPVEIWELDALEELILGDFWDERVGWEYHNTQSPNTAGHGFRSPISSFPLPPQSGEGEKPHGLQRLRMLSMHRVDLEDYAFLSYLPDLTELDVKSVHDRWEEGEAPPDLLSCLRRPLLRLNADSSKVITLPGLSAQENLEELRIDDTHFSMELLARFKHLRYLEIMDSRQRIDLSNLPGLPFLEALLGYGFKFSGTAMQHWLPQLKAFSYTPDETLSDEEAQLHASAFRRAVHLEHLTIKKSGTFDISDLAACTHLQCLKITCHHLASIDILGTFGQLHTLGLQIGYQPYTPHLHEVDDPAEAVSDDNRKAWLLLARQQCDAVFSSISGLIQLEALDLDGFPLEELAQLSKLLNLKSLRLSESGLATLHGISALKALEYLNLASAPLTDISEIAACEHLHSLILIDLPLTSLTGIEFTTQLVDIYLNRCKVAAVEPLAQLVHLEHITFFELPLTDLTPLGQCLALQTVTLWGMPISDVAPLALLPKLRGLELYDLAVEDYSPLEPLFRKWVFANLPEDERGSFLAFSYSNRRKNPPESIVRYMRPIDFLNYWDMLRVQAGETDFPWRHGVPVPEFNHAAVLEYLRKAKEDGLTRIDLYPLKLIGSMPAEIWELAHIEELNLAKSGWHWWEQQNFDHQSGGHAISQFPTPLFSGQDSEPQGLPLLRLLNLKDSQIDRLDFLRWMPNLLVLELQGTEIKDLTELIGLPHLQVLDIRNTAISDLGPLSQLSELRFVFLDGTQVSDLGPLKDCTKIVKLTYANTPAEQLEKGAP